MAWPYLRYRRYDGAISGDLDVILEAFDGLILTEVYIYVCVCVCLGARFQ